VGKMSNAKWKIICYHDVIAEETSLTKWIGVNVTPEQFRSHLDYMSNCGDLISVEDGLQRLFSGEGFDKDSYSVWFDDGFAGVRKNAFPICEEYGIKSAIAVNRNFVEKKDLFWRCKMSHLFQMGKGKELQNRIEELACSEKENVRSWTLFNYSEEVQRIVDEMFANETSSEFRETAFELFEDIKGLQFLRDSGWIVCNHSVSHYPVFEKDGSIFFKKQFENAQDLMDKFEKGNQRFWVIPFDPGDYKNDKEADFYRENAEDAIVVRAQNHPNSLSSWRKEKMLYRYLIDFSKSENLLLLK